MTRRYSLLIAIVGFAACDGEHLVPTSQWGDVVKSKKVRIAAPQVTTSDREALVGGNGAFAFDLYHRLAGEEAANFFFSPHSISAALAMLHAGARGNTERQIAQTMHYTLAQSALHPAFNDLDQQLSQRGQGKKGADGKAFQLNVVNATWGQSGHSFLSDYLDTLALNYGAGLRALNFADDPEASRKSINNWVEQQTAKRIKDLIPQGAIDGDTRLVLTNAIYFNAAWQAPFKTADTTDGDFTTLDGAKIKTKLMRGHQQAGYTKGTDFAAVELPYDGNEVSMVLIVPDSGKFAVVEKSLNIAQLKGDVLAKLIDSDVELTMPRFKIESTVPVKKHLIALGMTDVMDPRLADLSGINGPNSTLYVSDVLHKAFVNVDEAGTEAAAATAVVTSDASIPAPAKLVIDRPFLFLIRDLQTGAILFLGRVTQP